MDFYIDETVYTGSPEDMSGRLPREVRTYALLDTLGTVSYTHLDVYKRQNYTNLEVVLDIQPTSSFLIRHISRNLRQYIATYLLMDAELAPMYEQKIPLCRE